MLSDDPYDANVRVLDVFVFIDASDGEKQIKVEFVRCKNATRLVAAQDHSVGKC